MLSFIPRRLILRGITKNDLALYDIARKKLKRYMIRRGRRLSAIWYGAEEDKRYMIWRFKNAENFNFFSPQYDMARKKLSAIWYGVEEPSAVYDMARKKHKRYLIWRGIIDYGK